MKKIALAILLNLFFMANLYAQTLEAKVNRTEVPVGETLMLTLSTDKDTGKKVPDLGVLDKDFKVFQVANSFKSNYSNGKTNTERQWQIGMAPKNTGTLTIPAITLDGMSSKPLTIKVIKANIGEQTGPSDTSEAAKFAIKAEIDNENPYVQQQVNYIVTIYDMGGLQGGEPIVIDDGSNDWIVRTLKMPTVENKEINGRAGREIKMYYALFPQRSGKLQAPKIQFNGYYLTKNTVNSSPNDMLNALGISDMFAKRNPVFLTPEVFDVNVRPIPADSKIKWWVPATNVEITANWSSEKPEFREGEAIGRDIVIKITGILEKQLPEINFPQIKDMKQYPEKPQDSNIVRDEEVISIKKIHNIYIPNKSGNVTLPEISIDWFNTKTNSFERTTLPATTINIKPSANASDIEAGEDKIEETPTSNIETKPVEYKESNYNAYLGAFLTFVLGVGISYFIFRPRKEKKKNYKKAVIDAAKNRHYKVLRDELIEWGRQQYPNANINNLKDIAAQTNSKDFENKLNKLTNMLYSGKNADFDEVTFIKIFENVNKKKVVKKTAKQALPKLYE